MFIVMYHYVRKIQGSRYPGIKGMELHDFEKQITFFLNNGYHFVTTEDVLENSQAVDEHSALLTFDDGYADHFANVFPILDRYGIQGVFSMPGKIIREKKVLDVNKIHFVLANTDIEQVKKVLFQRMDYYRGSEFQYESNEELYQKLAQASRFDAADTIFVKRVLQVGLPEQVRNKISDELFQEFVSTNEGAFVDELYMSMDQVKTMKKHGMKFGFHGYDHYWMDQLTELQLREDIAKGLDVFEAVIDPQDWICCYPYGSCNDEVIRVAKDMGATSGMTTLTKAFVPGNDNIYKIPRLDTNDFPPKSENFMVL